MLYYITLIKCSFAGAFACVNSARMTLMDCRHRLCFDCLTSRINVAVAARRFLFHN